jgi:hypothetical protein
LARSWAVLARQKRWGNTSDAPTLRLQPNWLFDLCAALSVKPMTVSRTGVLVWLAVAEDWIRCKAANDQALIPFADAATRSNPIPETRMNTGLGLWTRPQGNREKREKFGL